MSSLYQHLTLTCRDAAVSFLGEILLEIAKDKLKLSPEDKSLIRTFSSLKEDLKQMIMPEDLGHTTVEALSARSRVLKKVAAIIDPTPIELASSNHASEYKKERTLALEIILRNNWTIRANEVVSELLRDASLIDGASMNAPSLRDLYQNY